MREILFRGRRIDNGEWVEGLILRNKLGTYIITEANPHECTQYGYIEIAEYCRVDPATAGQFTGLHDKNGRRIFEGDVLRYLKAAGHTSTGIVKYITEFARWEYWHTTQKEGFPVLSDCDSMEIIGTIHDEVAP